MLTFDTTFSAAEVCKGADIPMETLQNWMKRKLIIGHREVTGVDDSPGRGNRRRYSFFNLIEISLASVLTRQGATLEHAFTAAQSFSHVSSGQSSWVGDNHNTRPVRLPGLPFHHKHGFTFLFMSGARNAVVMTADGTVNMFSIGGVRDYSRGCIAINVTGLFRDIMGRMALDYREVLDGAYPAEATA